MQDHEFSLEKVRANSQDSHAETPANTSSKPALWTPTNLAEYLKGRHDMEMVDSPGYHPGDGQFMSHGRKMRKGRLPSARRPKPGRLFDRT